MYIRIIGVGCGLSSATSSLFDTIQQRTAFEAHKERLDAKEKKREDLPGGWWRTSRVYKLN